jgi:hypothetical protein
MMLFDQTVQTLAVKNIFLHAVTHLNVVLMTTLRLMIDQTVQTLAVICFYFHPSGLVAPPLIQTSSKRAK